jgi:hypothetical protein
VNPIGKDPLQARLEITNWVILVILVLLSWLFFRSPRFTLGVVLGSLISIVNFHWLHRDLRKIFSNLTGSVKGRIMFKYYIRLAVTAVVLYFIVSREIVDIIGLITGLSVVVINIVITAVAVFSKKNSVEEA